jgi:hypothetical protein
MERVPNNQFIHFGSIFDIDANLLSDKSYSLNFTGGDSAMNRATFEFNSGIRERARNICADP